jgi:hypothetical protein
MTIHSGTLNAQDLETLRDKLNRVEEVLNKTESLAKDLTEGMFGKPAMEGSGIGKIEAAKISTTTPGTKQRLGDVLTRLRDVNDTLDKVSQEFTSSNITNI